MALHCRQHIIVASSVVTIDLPLSTEWCWCLIEWISLILTSVLMKSTLSAAKMEISEWPDVSTYRSGYKMASNATPLTSLAQRWRSRAVTAWRHRHHRRASIGTSIILYVGLDSATRTADRYHSITSVSPGSQYSRCFNFHSTSRNAPDIENISLSHFEATLLIEHLFSSLTRLKLLNSTFLF